MSIYFFLQISVKSRHGRKATTSAKEKFIYIARQGHHKNRASELSRLCSGNMPGWGTDPIKFWKAVDKYEIPNGVLYRCIMFGLPTVLSEEQKIGLAEKFIKEVIGDCVFPYTYAIHEIDETNPHCHLIFSERMNDGLDRTPEIWFKLARLKPEDRSAVLPLKSPDDDKKSGARKASIYSASGGAKRYYLKIRKLWEITANEALKKAGHSERVDCRSNKERNIHRIKQIHLHPKDMAIEKKMEGIKTQKSKLNTWIEKANNRIESIEKIMGNSDYEYEMDMFMLGETKNHIEINFESLSIEDIREIIQEFFEEIKIAERVKKNMVDIRSEIEEIKEIKEMIERDTLEWEENNRRFEFVWETLGEFESKISYWETDMKDFNEEEKGRIGYFLEELSYYIPGKHFEKEYDLGSSSEEFNYYVSRYYSNEQIKICVSKIGFDEETKDRFLEFYPEYDKNYEIIKPGKGIPAEQYPEQVAPVKHDEQLNKTEVNNLSVEDKKAEKKKAKEKAKREAEEKARQEAKKAAELEEYLTTMAGKVEVREHLKGLSEFHVENLDSNLKRYTEDDILYAEIRDGKIFRDNFEKVLDDEFDLKKIGVLKERVLKNQLKKADRKKGKSSGIGIGD